jgi:hypothetical protein
MFIRKVRNKSGNTEIQVMQKVGRKNKIVKHIGTGRTPLELSHLAASAQEFIDNARISSGVLSLFDTRFEQSELDKLLTRLTFTQALDTLTYQFLSSFYHTVGFDSLQNQRFEDLVLARIADPASKRRTRDILEFRFGKRYTLTTIYRTLRSCYSQNYQEKVEGIVKKFVKESLKMRINVLFFDVTTLHYEAFDEDDTRKNGFSKVLKHNQPQIVVALTVTTEGIPLAMRLFEGNTFEGHTMLPSITSVMERFALSAKRIVIVADAAMISRENLKNLEEKQIKYIVGARLGTLTDSLFEKVIKKTPKKDGASRRFTLSNNRILIVKYPFFPTSF